MRGFIVLATVVALELPAWSLAVLRLRLGTLYDQQSGRLEGFPRSQTWLFLLTYGALLSFRCSFVVEYYG